MSSPMQLYLWEPGLNAGDLQNVQYLGVCDDITPAYFEDGAQAVLMETLEEVQVMVIHDPGLSTIQKSAQYDSFV